MSNTHECKENKEEKKWDEEDFYYKDLKEADYEKAFPFINGCYNSSITENAYEEQIEIREEIIVENENVREESPYSLYNNNNSNSKIEYEFKEVDHLSLYPNKKIQIPQGYFNYLNEISFQLQSSYNIH